ncbi:MAG: DUF5723 family protein [Saprospiraceae bacterium]
MFNKLLQVSVFFLMANTLWGQQELGLHFTPHLLQASKTNPALLTNTDHRVIVGLPSVLLSYYHDGPSFNDLIRKDSDGNNIVDVSSVLETLGTNNILQSNVEVETISLALNLGGLHFALSHSVKFNGFINYPKELPEFLWNGNAQFIGQTVDIGPDLQINAYNEFGIALAQRFNRLSVGAKVKFLTGIGDVSTSRRNVDVFTSNDVYQITLDTDLQLNTSSYLRIDSLTSFAVDTEIGNYRANDLFTANRGYAVDLGITYALTDRLTLGASVVDLGNINWSNSVRNYTSTGRLQYDGLDISNVIKDENVSFGNLTDTLDQIFKFEETAVSYKTTLPRKLYFSAAYQWNDLLTFNVLYFNENYREQSLSGFAIGANTHLGDLLSIGGSYAIRHGRFDNLGVNASLKLGPLQLYVITDNIIAAFQPYNSNNMNIRMGLNLVFGKTPLPMMDTP